MSITFFDHLSVHAARLRYFVPALVTIAAAPLLPHPALVFVFLLAANVLAMAAVCRAIGLDPEPSFARTLRRRAVPYFLLLIGYAGLLVLLTAYPLLWLLRERSLGATLAVSTEVVVALLCLWRLWPCFGLLFVWREAAFEPPGASPAAALARCAQLARRVSGQNELFFSHGLIVSFCILLAVAAAAGLAAALSTPAGSERIAYLALYGIVLLPAVCWIIANRCATALLIERLRQRRERRENSAPMAEPEVPEVTESHAATVEAVDLDVRLLRCARAGQVDLALGALAHGADPNAVPAAGDRDQRSVLVLATLGSDMRLLRQLIAKGANLNREHAGLTPLIAATRDSHQGRPDAVMTLLTNGADPRCADPGGNTPLHYAALSETPIVSALLCDASAPIDAINRDGLTPLGTACAAGNWKLARFLLERGAKPEVARAQPALLGAAAVADDDPSGVELLLRRKANVNARDALGRSALMIAALHGNAAVVDALLDAGADADLADTRGTTALMEAARSGAEDVLELLLARSPALDAVDATGRTALVIACQSRQAGEALVRRLVEAGASTSIAAADGKRAVDFAAASGRWNLVAMLDPDYPLPATVAEAASVPAEPDSPQHLLDALRFAHWNIADNFASLARAWPDDELARLFLALAEHEPSAARHWLLDHGLQAVAGNPAGDAVTAALIERLPGSAVALGDWLAAGASAAGTGRVNRVLAALSAVQTEQRAVLECLAAELISSGGDIFAPDLDGRGPLAQAVMAGASAITATLLERGADPNVRDRNGRTPLFDALNLPLEQARVAIPALIRAGANPEVAAINGETPLGLALARPEAELRAWLNWPQWKLPLRPLCASDLPAAAAAGDSDAVARLLDLGFPVQSLDAQGATALLRAAGCGHAALVRYLLERGADARQTAPSGATALSAAVSARREDVVTALLERGVDADHRLPTGGTPLMVAAALGFAEIVSRLLAAGADVNAADEKGTRALHAAAQYAFRSNDSDGARRLIELLLRSGADVDATNAAGQTALLLLLGGRASPGVTADQKHLVDLLPLFILARADVNRQDQRGVGPLHACAMHGLLLPARTLLGAHADPARRDVLDRTARQVAHLLGYVDVAAELGARESSAQLANGG